MPPRDSADKKKARAKIWSLTKADEGEHTKDVLIISYDQLKLFINEIKKVRGIGLLICDEGHKLKNAKIKTSQVVNEVPSKRRIVLSGTPIQNDLQEFHSMVPFVNPGVLGTVDVFRRFFEEPILRSREPDADETTKSRGKERSLMVSAIRFLNPKLTCA